MPWLVCRAGELDFIILDGDGDVRINFLAQLTKRSLNLHNVAREYFYTHLVRKAYRQFTDS